MTAPARLAVVALLLSVPAPSLTVWVGLIALPGEPLGQLLYGLGKLWTLLLPLAWFLWLDGGMTRLRSGGAAALCGWPQRRGLAVGLISGVALAAVVTLALQGWATRLLEPEAIRAILARAGIDDGARFAAFALYWTVFNSLFEELVWRGFVLYQLRVLTSPGVALALSAVGFSAHHAVATWSYLQPLPVALVVLATAAAGAIWAAMTLRYRTLWPAYVSHVIADLAIFIAAYRLLYGGA